MVWIVGDQIVDGSESGTSFRQALSFMDWGLRLHQTLIYQASDFRAFSPDRYGRSCDYMFVLSRRKPRVCNRLRDRLHTALGHKRIKDLGFGRGLSTRSKHSKPFFIPPQSTGTAGRCGSTRRVIFRLTPASLECTSTRRYSPTLCLVTTSYRGAMRGIWWWIRCAAAGRRYGRRWIWAGTA